MTPTELLADFQFHMLVWDYSILGPGTTDELAYVCEHPGKPLPSGRPWWDRTAADLAGELVSYGDGLYERAPDHWALPGVTELRLRGYLQEAR